MAQALSRARRSGKHDAALRPCTAELTIGCQVVVCHEMNGDREATAQVGRLREGAE